MSSPPSPATAPPPELPERPEGAPPPRAQGADRWPPWSGLVALLTALVIAFAGGAIASAIATLFGAELDDPPPPVLIIATLIQDAALVAAAIGFARVGAATGAAQFGLVRTRIGAALGWGVLTWIGFLLFAAAWTTALGIEEEDRVVRELGADESTFAFVVVAVLVTVIAPLVEEFFFRGFFYRSLRNWRGMWPAAVLTGVVFGAIHLGSSPVGFVLPLAVFGVALCLLYERTGSLLPCIGVHALNNSIAFGVGEDWTWQIALLAPAAIAACLLVSWAIARRWTAPAHAPA